MENILITRGQEAALDLVQTLEKAGFKVFVEPLFSLKKIAITQDIFDKKNTEKNSTISALIITSANSCQALCDLNFSYDIKIYAVGRKTAQKLIQLGFKNIEIAPENSAESLKNLILERHLNKAGIILYFHGSIITLDFQNELEKFGFKVKKILCYQTREVKNFSTKLLQFTIQNSFDRVLLFSENNAQIFFKLVQQHNLLEYFKCSQILCLSEKILSRVRSFGFSNSIIFSQFPILKNFYD